MSFKDSAYKAIVYFKNQPDGVGRLFYSRDHIGNRKTAAPQKGLMRLQKMIITTFKGKYNTALIYNNSTGELKEKYVKDELIISDHEQLNNKR